MSRLGKMRIVIAADIHLLLDMINFVVKLS